jgi:hypothetical protein
MRPLSATTTCLRPWSPGTARGLPVSSSHTTSPSAVVLLVLAGRWLLILIDRKASLAGGWDLQGRVGSAVHGGPASLDSALLTKSAKAWQ